MEHLNYKELLADLGGNEEVMKELLISSTESLSEDLTALADAISEKNYSTARRVAHRMKGVALNFRFEALVSKLMKAEDYLNSDKSPGDYLELIEKELKLISSEIDQ